MTPAEEQILLGIYRNSSTPAVILTQPVTQPVRTIPDEFFPKMLSADRSECCRIELHDRDYRFKLDLTTVSELKPDDADQQARCEEVKRIQDRWMSVIMAHVSRPQLGFCFRPESWDAHEFQLKIDRSGLGG